MQDGLSSSIDYWARKELGSGAFGTVYKAIDMDRGRYMAVKYLNRRPMKDANRMDVSSRRTEYAFDENILVQIKKEVEALARLRHPHIIELLGLSYSAERLVLCMSLKEGTVTALVKGRRFDSTEMLRLGCGLLHQITQALAYLASYNIVHHDIKPANILYTAQDHSECGFHFTLSDFGLCMLPAQATCFVGTRIYGAPEVWDLQYLDAKCDIWALYVTIAWTLDINRFQTSPLPRTRDGIIALVQATRSNPIMTPIRDMASTEPQNRPSASALQQRLFGSGSIEDAVKLMQQGHGAQSAQPTRQQTSRRNVEAIIATGRQIVKTQRQGWQQQPPPPQPPRANSKPLPTARLTYARQMSMDSKTSSVRNTPSYATNQDVSMDKPVLAQEPPPRYRSSSRR